tara:strand:- start:442 stop:699 length:258 start_codon:yes stop_codon:yes gene_type:complete
VGDDFRGFIYTAVCDDINLFWVHDGRVCGMVGFREIMSKSVETENNVIPIPQISDLDKQFLVLEDQKELIREQAKLILEKKRTKI